MFARDWRRWGSLKIYEEELHVAVHEGAAWIAAFATVVRDGSDGDAARRHTFDRLRDHAAAQWDSRRVLCEALARPSCRLASSSLSAATDPETGRRRR